VVFFGFPFVTVAAITGCASLSFFNPGSWGTTAQDVFIAPEDFNTLPIGEPVSLIRWFGAALDCHITNTTEHYAVGMVAVPGAENVQGSPGMFTTPELKARGLGYRVGWYTYLFAPPSTDATPYRSLTSITETTPPIDWATPSQVDYDAGLIYGRADVAIQFFKIGNIQDTGGVRIPASISTELIRLYLADSANPTDTTWNVPFVWNTSTFVSKVRACTPTLGPNSSFVNLGTVTPTSTPVPGTVLLNAPFTLTFNCPYLAYEQIGFSFDPVHGLEGGDTTMMKLKSGAGMAEGAGIRLKMDLNGSWETVNYGQNYTIPDFNVLPWWEWAPSSDALNDTKSRTINFEAELVRVTGNFAPGKVDSTLLIVMRYK